MDGLVKGSLAPNWKAGLPRLAAKDAIRSVGLLLGVWQAGMVLSCPDDRMKNDHA